MNPHISEHLIALYVVGQLPADREPEIEEHLLICPECIDRVKNYEIVEALLDMYCQPAARTRAAGG